MEWSVAGLGSGWSSAAVADDTVLFSSSVPPNVLLLVDNSYSMNHIVWHEDFDPAAVPSCNNWDNDLEYAFGNDQKDVTACTRTRDIFTDKDMNEDTRYTGRYLNWLFSPEADRMMRIDPLRVAIVDSPGTACVSAFATLDALLDPWRIGTGLCSLVTSLILELDPERFDAWEDRDRDGWANLEEYLSALAGDPVPDTADGAQP